MTQAIIPDSPNNVKSNHSVSITPKEVVSKTIANKGNISSTKEAEGAEETPEAKEASARMTSLLSQLQDGQASKVCTEALKRGEELLKRAEGYPTPEDLDRLASKILKG